MRSLKLVGLIMPPTLDMPPVAIMPPELGAPALAIMPPELGAPALAIMPPVAIIPPLLDAPPVVDVPPEDIAVAPAVIMPPEFFMPPVFALATPPEPLSVTPGLVPEHANKCKEPKKPNRLVLPNRMVSLSIFA